MATAGTVTIRAVLELEASVTPDQKAALDAAARARGVAVSELFERECRLAIEELARRVLRQQRRRAKKGGAK